MQHPRLGHDLIRPVSLWSNAADIILQHHERYDGTGYPLMNRGTEIPLGARVLSVAETFDVLASEDSYQKQLDHDAAVREIEENSGTQFDPVVVKALKLRIMEAGVVRN